MNKIEKENFIKKIEYLISQNAILLDVRTYLEYKKKRICGSINISTPKPPLSEKHKKDLSKKIEDIIITKRIKYNTPILVYSYQGIRSKEAIKILQQITGMHNLYNLGGITTSPLSEIFSGAIQSNIIKICRN